MGINMANVFTKSENFKSEYCSACVKIEKKFRPVFVFSFSFCMFVEKKYANKT